MKSSELKKILAMVIISTLLLSITGCNKTQTKTTPAPSTNVSSDPLAKYSTPITIKIGRTVNSDFKFLGGDTADSNAWTKMYKDELNIDVKNMWVVDQSQATTKMNTAIASGDYPDIFSVTPSDYQKYANSGVIADVTSLYDKYMTAHGKEIVNSDNGYALNSAKINGKLYGIPSVNNPYDSANILFLRKDWLTKLNLQVPKTAADVAKIAAAFTNQDPDSNGKKDTYGLALDGKDVANWWGGVEPFFEMYGAYPVQSNSGYSLIKDSSGNLVWGGSLDGMKPALTELQNYYKSGFVAKDFGTMDYNKAIAEVTSGRAGMFFAPMFGAMTVSNDFLKTNPSGELIAVPIPGADANTPGKAYLPSSLGNITVISSKCKNPEAVFKIFCEDLEKVAFAKDAATYNKFYGDSTTNTGWKLAITGGLLPMKNYINFQKVSVAVEKKDPSGLNLEQTAYYNQVTKDYQGKPVNGTDLAYVASWGVYNVFADPNGGYAAVDKLIKAKSYVMDGFGGAPTGKMSAVASTLSDLAKTKIIKIIYGSATPDSWDSVVSNWKKIGGDDVLTDSNAWLKSTSK